MATRKIVLVTGANYGCGYETVKAFLKSPNPYHVFLGSRSWRKGNDAVQTLRKDCADSKNSVGLLQVDLTDDQSIENAFDQVKSSHDRLDILINNAGANWDMSFLKGKASLRESFTKAYDVNTAGTHVLTWTFMPLLLKSTEPRLMFVSGLSSITQAAEKYFPTPPQPAGWPKKIQFEVIGYRCSKVALNMMMLDWNHKLKEDGVKVHGVGPGMLDTGLGGLSDEEKEATGLGAMLKPASWGGEFLLRVAEGERDADVGKVVTREGLLQW